MTEEKTDLSEQDRKKLKKKHDLINMIGVLTMVAGAFFLIFGMMMWAQWQTIDTKKYLTDPDLPISEWKNATFTITHETIIHQMWDTIYLVIPGAFVVLLGFGIGATNQAVPGDIVLHKLTCHGSAEWKYCPECGLKLERLEEKK